MVKMKYLLLLLAISLLSLNIIHCEEDEKSKQSATEELKEEEPKEKAKFLLVPEDVTAQNEFITNSEINLSVDMPFDSDQEFVTVPTHYGKVKGFREESSKGKPFYSYLGVPYAKPPVKELRFKQPEYPDKWEDVREATIQPPVCSQFDVLEFLTKMNPEYVGQEDCLYLNIFTPKPNMSFSELPVLLYIHGGQYISGGAKDYKPHYILNEEVVLVVIQYRLGLFGFMSTEDDVLPGNLGLRDQTKALLWIHRNIEFFGGSPLKVALFGSEAGAASVHFQSLSHLAIGLFTRGIMQSGNALCPWALGGAHKAVAQHIGRKFECKSISSNSEQASNNEESPEILKQEEKIDNENTLETEEKIEEAKEIRNEANDQEINNEDNDQETLKIIKQEDSNNEENLEKQKESEKKVQIEEIPSEQLVQCLREVDAQDITMIMKDYFMWNTFPIIFGPVVDDIFLAGTPEFLLKEKRHKRFDVMVGINRDEGAFIASSSFASEGRRLAVKSHFQLVGPISLEFTDQDLAPLNMSLKAYDHYLHGIDLERHNADNVTKLFGDRHFAVATDIAAMFHADNNIQRKKNVYFYELHHRGAKSSTDHFGLKLGQHWVSHGDELQYLFPTGDEERSEDDVRMTDIMTNMWRNFASNGNPTYNESLIGFQWEPFTSSQRKHLTLKPEPTMDDDYRQEIREFWTSLPTQQNLHLFQDKFSQLNKGKEQKPSTTKDEL